MAASPEVSLRQVMALALPASLAAVLQNAYRPLDQFFLKYVGSEAQGALGAVTFVLIVAYGVFIVVSAGVGPLVARATGADDPEARRDALGAGVLGCLVLAVLLATVGSALADPLAGMLGTTGLTRDLAARYMFVVFATGAALVFGPLVDSTFHAMGNTRLPMALQGVSLALNAVLTPVFILELGWGVAGAALGSTIAQTVSVGIGFVLLARQTGLRWRHVRGGLPHLAQVVRIGAPIGVSTIFYAAVYWAVMYTSIAPLGDDVYAGLGIGFNALEAFSWPLYVGFAVAVSSLVGRRLGAKDVDGAWAAVRIVMGPAAAVGIAVWAVFLFAGPALVDVFAADEGARVEGVRYALILAWSQPFVAIEAACEGVLGGAGDTRKVFWGTVPFNLVRIPLAYGLAFGAGWGAAGVWWAINTSTVLKAVVKGAMVVHGGWARVKL